MVAVVSGGLHLTPAEGARQGVGFRAVTSAFPKLIGFGERDVFRSHGERSTGCV